MFIYCILLVSFLFHSSVPHYYYFARYMTPFIFIIGLAAGILITRKIISKILFCIAAASILPYTIFIGTVTDDEKMSWDSLDRVITDLSEADAVIYDPKLSGLMGITVSYADNTAYYTQLDGLTIMGGFLSEKYESVYYVSYAECSIPLFEEADRIEVEISSDTQPTRAPIPFPFFDIETDHTYIYIYRINDDYILTTGESMLYDVNQLRFENYQTVEGDYVWSAGENTETSFFVPATDGSGYSISLKFNAVGAGMYWQLGMESFPLQVSLNGTYIGSWDLCENPVSVDMGDVSEYIIPGAVNTLEITSPSWSPEDLGSEDDRTLGFALEGIEITALT